MEMQEWLNWIVPIGTMFAALISARASKISANAARRSNAAAFAALEENRKIAQNDWRIRLMEERMRVWRAYDDLLVNFALWDRIDWEDIAKANEFFQISPFLFPVEVSAYLTEFCDIATRHGSLYKKVNQSTVENLIDSTDSHEMAASKKEMDELYAWLRKQRVEGTELFQKYMSLID